MRAQIVISLILTAIYAAGFALLRLPLWFVVAPLCGLLNLIPRFGAVFGMLVGVLVALFGGLDAIRWAALIGIYVLAFAIEGYWLTPWLLGRRLGVRPLYVFLAVLVGGALFGFLGLLLAVPVLAVALVVYRFVVGAGSGGRP